MSAKKGIRKHGQAAIQPLIKGFAQFEDKLFFCPLLAAKLTRKQRCAALRVINIIKEKRDGALKGRACADGRPQGAYYTKEETSSPTLSNNALMLSLIIDAAESRDVAVANVAGAYLNALMDEFVEMKIEDEIVDIMCKVNPEYEAYVILENGKRVLYVQLMRALFGCVRSALLWYESFATTLEAQGFKLNPYDACIANKDVNGSQCTIVWYVDDTKISHKDAAVVTDVNERVEAKFGKMTVLRGRKHIFLGMDIEFHEDKTVTVMMTEYLKRAIADFGEPIVRSATLPATRTLFDIDEKSPPLGDLEKERFHSVVACLFYVCQRGRPDLQACYAFLMHAGIEKHPARLE